MTTQTNTARTAVANTTAATFDLSTDSGRELAYYPIFNAEAWDEAQRAHDRALEALSEAQSSHSDIYARFVEGDPAVAPSDVRDAELILERAQRTVERSEEPVAWLVGRRAEDDYSKTHTGMPSGLRDRRLALKRVLEKLRDHNDTFRTELARAERERFESTKARAERNYHDAVSELEARVARGKLTQDQAQAVADVQAEQRDAEIEAARKILSDYEAKRKEHWDRLRAEQGELLAFLAEHDPARPGVKLARR